MLFSQELGRRGVLKAGAAGAAMAAIWAKAARAAPRPQDDTQRLFDRVSDLVVPATTVPGALAAGVPAFLAIAIAHNTLGTKGDEAGRLLAELNEYAGAAFLDLLPARQHATLQAFDAACFSFKTPSTYAWPVVKALILAGYYSSQTGGSQDQHYDLVPGRYDADIPYHGGDPALSNDWAGLAFL
jgi:hypothetical protein